MPEAAPTATPTSLLPVSSRGDGDGVVTLPDPIGLPAELLDRAKFLAIFSSNLDEFFQVRVAGLKDQVFAGVGTRTPDGRTPSRQLAELRAGVAELCIRQEHIFHEMIIPELAEAGIAF